MRDYVKYYGTLKELDGMGAVLVNMGINTLICTTYLLAIGGARQRGGHQTGHQQGHEQYGEQFLHG